MAQSVGVKYQNVVQAVLFQANWFACVLGGALWGAAGICLLAWFSARVGRLSVDLCAAGVAALVGLCLDTLWIHLGVLDFAGAPVAPLWIVFLWMGVGMSLNHSLSFFKAHPLLGGLLGAMSAPLCYLAGERLGAVVVADAALLGLVAAVWFGVFWAAFAGLADDIDKRSVA